MGAVEKAGEQAGLLRGLRRWRRSGDLGLLGQMFVQRLTLFCRTFGLVRSLARTHLIVQVYPLSKASQQPRLQPGQARVDHDAGQ